MDEEGDWGEDGEQGEGRGVGRAGGGGEGEQGGGEGVRESGGGGGEGPGGGKWSRESGGKLLAEVRGVSGRWLDQRYGGAIWGRCADGALFPQRCLSNDPSHQVLQLPAACARSASQRREAPTEQERRRETTFSF